MPLLINQMKNLNRYSIEDIFYSCIHYFTILSMFLLNNILFINNNNKFSISKYM